MHVEFYLFFFSFLFAATTGRSLPLLVKFFQMWPNSTLLSRAYAQLLSRPSHRFCRALFAPVLHDTVLVSTVETTARTVWFTHL